MTEFKDKSVLITGGARGQGRSHALHFAARGANIALLDRPDGLSTAPYPLASQADMQETKRLVEEAGVRCIALDVDVRNGQAMTSATNEVAAQLGSLDIVIANAGVASYSLIKDMTDELWSDVIATNLTGVFNTIRAAIPHVTESRNGRVIVTASVGGRQGNRNIAHYISSKWGVLGLVKSAAIELAEHGVTVNAVAPTTVSTKMVMNSAYYQTCCPDVTSPTLEDVRQRLRGSTPIPEAWIEPYDVSHAVLYLASEGARFVTGVTLGLDLGVSAKMP
jgi:SDR family mycofactocin-dependent oxidoreductase